MANIFEVETDASQDANYREHLNRNWQNGNTEFDKLENWLNALKTTFSNFQVQINDLQQQIWNLTKRVQTDEVKHDQDVADLNAEIKVLDDEVQKLNQAVFGIDESEINYVTPKQSDVIEEINYQKNKKSDKSKNINQFNKDPVSHELNYSAVNGKHNSIEVDTGIGHMKGEKL